MGDFLKSIGTVAPFAGAWIEIHISLIGRIIVSVAPFAGAWIEIPKEKQAGGQKTVAPFAGAWIEILVFFAENSYSYCVAPFAGAWIEIYTFDLNTVKSKSLPSRERGLKSH